MSGNPAEPGLNPSVADARARLQRLAFLVLSPSLGRRRRALIAHVAVDRTYNPEAPYAVLRELVLRRTLATGRRRAVLASCGARPRASAPDLVGLFPAARAAYALRHLEGLDRSETYATLAAAGVGDPAAATTLADRLLTHERPGLPGRLR
ncbi:hypothetical protein [Sporichthya polymorpha]|uniref:hypothetical protein n=1 Tax=Sporichthya polymorpha TaxID=35751 RepID=UPI0003624554|nr:hypothetical protein [Sporichthya polymorpha]